MATVEALRTLRALLLPLPAAPEKEAECADMLEASLAAEGITVSDYGSWVSLKLGEWKDSGAAPASLVNVVKAVIAGSDQPASGRLAERYFECHETLRNEHFYSHDEARWFLSHGTLIYDLSTQARMTAAQIANLLTLRDARASFSRQSVESFQAKLQASPSLMKQDVNDVYESDKAAEPAYFADAGMDEAADLIAESAGVLGFPRNIAEPLKVLAPSGHHPTRFVPYIQMLHYQCTIAEFYDHALTDLYEFSPRGVSATELFDKYPPLIAAAANPYLNNAKAVERADSGWVRMKKAAERPGTMALQEILAGLQDMGFAARRELARLLRLWCHRFVRLSMPLTVALPNTLAQESWKKLLNQVGGGNTSSYGIIEQRVVDTFATGQHKEADGWRSRGVGSSVNATNISQKKVGDCEFQHAESRVIRAFESHGGSLSSIYVDDHLRTLRKTLTMKKAELELVADPAEWKIELIFVAHDIVAAGPARNENIEGINVDISYTTFAEFIAGRELDAELCDDLDVHVLGSASQLRTPHEVRTRILEITA